LEVCTRGWKERVSLDKEPSATEGGRKTVEKKKLFSLATWKLRGNLLGNGPYIGDTLSWGGKKGGVAQGELKGGKMVTVCHREQITSFLLIRKLVRFEFGGDARRKK